AAAPCLDREHAGVLQRLDRLADRMAADAHRGCQAALAGQHLLVAEPAGLDQVDDLLDDGVHRAVRFDRSEELDLRSLRVDGRHVLCRKRAITGSLAYRWWSVYRTARSSGIQVGVR